MYVCDGEQITSSDCLHCINQQTTYTSKYGVQAFCCLSQLYVICLSNYF